jgi:hypothetical protein
MISILMEGLYGSSWKMASMISWKSCITCLLTHLTRRDCLPPSLPPSLSLWLKTHPSCTSGSDDYIFIIIMFLPPSLSLSPSPSGAKPAPLRTSGSRDYIFTIIIYIPLSLSLSLWFKTRPSCPSGSRDYILIIIIH